MSIQSWVSDDDKKFKQPCNTCGTLEDVVQLFGYCIQCLNEITERHRDLPKMKPKSLTNGTSNGGGWKLLGVRREVDASTSDVVRTVTVDSEIAKHAKPHQREGVDFLWRNCFCDCNYHDELMPCHVGGALLAHFMGLGKSYTTITLLHTVLTCPTMTARGKPLFTKILIAVPTNTLKNWEDEVHKWTGSLQNPLKVKNMGGVQASYRESEIKKWRDQGGLLLMGPDLFRVLCDFIVQNAQPEVLVVDEAHTMLKCPATKIYKSFDRIKTRRRILLSGTPLQNNVTEYYHLVEFIRPGAFGVASQAEFECKFRSPIEDGLTVDAPVECKLDGLKKQLELKRTLDPHVHRKGPNILRAELPPISDTIIFLQQTVVQARVLGLYKKLQESGEKSKNFFSTYSLWAPLLNHPGCLKVALGFHSEKIRWKSDVSEGDEWLREGLKDSQYENLEATRNSTKLIALVHIIAMARKLEEKVLVYSKCLKTLDLIELFLSSADWKKQVISLRDSFPDMSFEKLVKNRDFVRIDGTVDSGERGCFVEQFNDDAKGINIFLISSKAGGIGINLCSATIVVMMDNHFNPTVTAQCVARAYRYGQTKPVRCYRLAIENSVEAKVYKRSKNKNGVSMRVIDGIHSDHLYSKAEISSLLEIDFIVTCNICSKKRLLQYPPPDEEVWHCSMDQSSIYSSCSVPVVDSLQVNNNRGEFMDQNHSNDPILKHLCRVINVTTRKTPIVTGCYPVENTGVADICCDEAIRKLEKEISNRR